MRLLFILAFGFSSLQLFAGQTDSLEWMKKKADLFTLYYTLADQTIATVIEKDLLGGIKTVTGFFQKQSFTKKIDVYIFPNREELNSQWRKDWGMPGFNSECWMVASGTAQRLDVLSPLSWKKQACDHNADDSMEIAKIIAHELVHVFHAQHNPNPTFDGMDDLSWLIEGVATVVSNQLGQQRLNRVRAQLKEGKIPTALSQFWTGADKYGRAGSFVNFLVEKYGKAKIFELLAYKDLPTILKSLKTREAELIEQWKNKMLE
jgi:hypothetical protein